MAATVFDPNLFQFNVFQIGNPATTGDVSVTLGNVTCVSNTVGSRSAVLNVTLGAVQAQSTATIPVTGNVAVALDGVTLDAALALGATGNLAGQLADVAVSSTASVAFGITSSLTGYLSDVTAVAYGDTYQETTLNVTLDDVTCSSAETTRTRAVTTRRTRNGQITKRAA